MCAWKREGSGDASLPGGDEGFLGDGVGAGGVDEALCLWRDRCPYPALPLHGASRKRERVPERENTGVSGGGVSFEAKQEEIAGTGFFDRLEMAEGGGEHVFAACGFGPVGGIVGEGFGFVSIESAPDASDEAEAVGAGSAEARAVVEGGADPAAGFGEDFCAVGGVGVFGEIARALWARPTPALPVKNGEGVGSLCLAGIGHRAVPSLSWRSPG